MDLLLQKLNFELQYLVHSCPGRASAVHHPEVDFAFGSGISVRPQDHRLHLSLLYVAYYLHFATA